MRKAIGVVVTVAATLVVGRSLAQSVVAPAGRGQQALAVGVTSKGVFARACPAAAGCVADGGAALKVPEDVLPLIGRARVAAVPLEGGRHVVKVEIAGTSEGAAWVMLVAGPLAAWSDQAPATLLRGWTGRPKGEHGEGRSSVVLEEGPASARRIVIGHQREDATLCGRPAIVGAKALDPQTMTLVPASVDNLSGAERSKATRLIASRAEPRPLSGARLLRAEAATSGAASAAALTDGDPETTWSEEGSGDGRGEFVRMAAATEVGITALELRVRPSKGSEGNAPRTFLVATSDRLFHVTMPEDAWAHPGAAYEVLLPGELRSSCVAVVLDSAYGAAGAAGAKVTLAEVSARTAFDGATPEALVGALAGGGPRAEAAAALLARGGEAAAKAAADGYAKLDEDGKRLALGVIESAGCPVEAPFFAARIQGKDREAEHARDRLRRCGKAAAPLLVEMIAKGKDAAKIAAAAELTLIAPDASVAVILDALPAAREATRRELRKSLAHAAKSPRAWPAFAREVEAREARPLIARIDLLRALGPSIGRVAGAGPALASLAAPAAEFRTRYLLLAPAAELAASGDAEAIRWLREALRKDADPHVRARAADVAGRVAALGPDLVAAADDPEVRVREAAVRSLGRAPRPGEGGGALPPSGEAVLLQRLAGDPWTFVRSGAARALATAPARAATDTALAAALADASPEVRGDVVDALGARRAVAHAPKLRERADDDQESLDVRARSMLALAAMCDKASIDVWTRLALRTASPQSEKDQRLGAAAIAALGRVHPADLSRRLRPLIDGKDVPRGVRDMARAAVATRDGCR